MRKEHNMFRDYQLINKFLTQHGLRSLRGDSVRDFNFPGIYMIWNSEEELIYIGQSSSVRRRLREHSTDFKGLIKCGPLYTKWQIAAAPIPDNMVRESTEQALIALLKPRHNKYGNPDFSFKSPRSK